MSEKRSKNKAAAEQRGRDLAAGDDTPGFDELVSRCHARAEVRAVAVRHGVEIPGVDPELIEASRWTE
jgi:hypothetical protein